VPDKTQLRDHPVIQNAAKMVHDAWSVATSAPPVVGALAGIAIIFTFGVIVPLLLHIFFGDIDGLTGVILGAGSSVVGTALRVFGVFGALIFWGAAVRNFAEQRRK
jgi:hypothetical protein